MVNPLKRFPIQVRLLVVSLCAERKVFARLKTDIICLKIQMHCINLSYVASKSPARNYWKQI